MDDLKASEKILDFLNNGHLVVDDSFVVYYWNRWLSENSKIDSKDIVGKNLKDFYKDIDYEVLLKKIKSALKSNSPTFYDSSTSFLPIKRTTGTNSTQKYMHQQVTISPYIVSQNKVILSIGDISELVEAKFSLESKINKVNQLNKVLKNDNDIIDRNIMIMKTTTTGEISDVSRLFCDFFGYKKEDLVGKKASILKSGKIPMSVYKELWKTITNKNCWSGEIENLTSSGACKWVESRISPIFDDDGNIIEFNAVYHDIKNKKLLEELYQRDSLTKLYNRGYFDELMSSITLFQRKADIDFIILIVDIDHFKSINDKHGHQFGDEVLKDVASVLKNSLRDDDVIARWGGEEFVIMLKNTTIDDAKVVAEKLRAKMQNTKVQDSIDLTGSFGLTKYYVGEDTNETFKRADEALYKAKKEGRNRVVVKL